MPLVQGRDNNMDALDTVMIGLRYFNIVGAFPGMKLTSVSQVVRTPSPLHYNVRETTILWSR